MDDHFQQSRRQIESNPSLELAHGRMSKRKLRGVGFPDFQKIEKEDLYDELFLAKT